MTVRLETFWPSVLLPATAVLEPSASVLPGGVLPKLQLDSSELGSAGFEDAPAVGPEVVGGGAEVEDCAAEEAWGALLGAFGPEPAFPPTFEGPAIAEVVEFPCCDANAMGLKVQPSGSTTPAGKPASPCLKTGPLAKYACGIEEGKT